MFSGIHKFIVSFFGAVFGIAFIVLTIVFFSLVVFGLEIEALPKARDYDLKPETFITLVTVIYGFFVWLLGFFSVSIVGYYQRKEMIELLWTVRNSSIILPNSSETFPQSHREEPKL